MDVAIVIFDELDAVPAKRSSSRARPAATSGLGCGPGTRVEAHSGLRIATDGVLSGADADLLLVPGGG